MKRFVDVAIAGAGLLMLSPLLAVVAIAVRFVDGKPVLFRHTRIGQFGKPFVMFKFRTMRRDVGGAEVTVDGDSRITRLGNILRKTKLDELPQLFNVIRGDMSIVGPRPEVASFVRLYTPHQRRVLDLLPGITDPASIKYRYESEMLASSDDPGRDYVETIMPDKIRINLDYAQRKNIVRDFGVMLHTIKRLAS